MERSLSIRSAAIRALGLASIAALLVGCSGLPHLPSTATTQPVSSPAESQGAAVTLVDSNVPSLATDAIKSVIQRGNDEEVQAIADQDVTVIRDTSTSAYYDQLSQSVNDMLSAGVSAIQLVNLTWGPITMQGTAAAQATTVETWRTTLADGSTLQQADTNVYTLVYQGGAWKVQDDQHPNVRASSPATGGSGSPTPVTPVAPVAPAGSGQSQSGNWSGYDATGGTFTAVAGSWTVPQVSADTSGVDATWVGIGGVTTHDLIQAGTQAVVQSGQVVYTAWWETLPQASQTIPLDISAGDTVSVSITQQSKGTWQIVILDVTTGETFRKSVAYQSSLSSAEWVEEVPSAGRGMLLP